MLDQDRNCRKEVNIMGYVLPSLEDLPLPTLEEFAKNPKYYWGKLREYGEVPYFYRHFGLVGLRKFIKRKVEQWRKHL